MTARTEGCCAWEDDVAAVHDYDASVVAVVVVVVVARMYAGAEYKVALALVCQW